MPSVSNVYNLLIGTFPNRNLVKELDTIYFSIHRKLETHYVHKAIEN